MQDASLVTVKELYDQAATEAATADGVITGPFQYNASFDPNIYYFEVVWDGYTIANSNKKYQCCVGLYYGDQWDASNDWSYQGLPVLTDSEMFGDGNEVQTDYICVYAGGELVGGIEPDGSTPKPAETTTTETTTTITTTTTTTVTTVSTTSAASETTTAQTSTSSSDTVPVLYGDVNLDGKVDLTDAITMNKYQAKVIVEFTSAQMANANCDIADGTGTIDEKDAIALINFVIMIEKELPKLS